MDKTFDKFAPGIAGDNDNGRTACSNEASLPRPDDQRREILYRNIPILVCLNTGLILAMAWLGWPLLSPHLLLPWLLFMGLNCVLLQFVYEYHQRHVADDSPWLGMARFMSTCIALGWGVGGVLLLPTLDPPATTLYLGMMGLLLLASVPLLGIDRHGQILFVTSLLAGATLWPLGLPPLQVLLFVSMTFILLTLLQATYYRHINEALLYAEQQTRMADAINQAYQQSRHDLQRHRYQQRARNSEHHMQSDAHARLQSAVASLDSGLAFTNPHGAIEFMNTCAERLTGWPLSAAHGRSVNDIFKLMEDDSDKAIKIGFEECRDQAHPVRRTGSVLLQRHDGLRYAVETTISPMPAEQGGVSGTVICFRDVTEQRNYNRRISWEASHDPLTKLINRREFEKRLERLLTSSHNEGSHHALCYLDLDQFKLVNDSCGHSAGDQLLQQLAKSLHSRIRETDTFARIGGDEFGILLYRCDMEKARMLAEGIHQIIKDLRFDWQDTIHRIGASIGLVSIDGSWSNAADLLKAADLCCYQAKDKGRNCIQVYDDQDLGSKIDNRQQSLQDIMRSLDRDDFDISLLGLRPLAATPATLGGEPYCEVRVHMHDRSGETIPADRLLATAERYRLLPRIDRWITKATLDAIRLNNPAVADKDTIAIRLSAQSVLDEGFLDYLRMQLDSEPVDPSRLCFVIKGGSLLRLGQQAQGFIANIKDLGCRIALEDFDAGLDSLRQLKSMQVDYIKIGGEILGDLRHHPENPALVEAINRLGHTLGARTIAGAVDDPGQLAALRAAGVDYVQEREPLQEIPLLGKQSG